MRVVLRQAVTGHYLQPSGEWTPARESARCFISAVAAYFWAIEEKLLGTEVWLALTDPHKDFACMRVSGRCPIIDCNHPDWNSSLHSLLFNGVEVDLVNFDFAEHGNSCELLAQASAMEFALDRDPAKKAARFRCNHQ